MKQIITLILFVLLLNGCAQKTDFYGESHLTPNQCKDKCKEWGMTLTGMVAMGEYSVACVCEFPPSEKNAFKGSLGGSLGVIFQSRKKEEEKEEERRRRSQSHR